MTPSRYIQLTDDEDTRLRDIEQNAHVKPKVRLRAQVLRLSHRGHMMQEIASSTGRHRSSISRDFDRWETHGLAGLADGTAPGQPPRVTAEVRTYLRERLAADRTWTAGQLADAVETRFGVTVSAEAIRQHLHVLGYAWKRTRYVPAKPPDPEAERAAREELAGLKKGLVPASSC